MADYLNVLVTLGAALIAYRAYVSTTLDNRSKHVHELFKEYLKARMDVEKDAEEFVGFRLYVLEETFNWAKKIKRSADKHSWLISADTYDEQRKFSKAWLATIQAHLKFEPAENLAAINEHKACYTPSFVTFAEETLGSPQPKP